MSLHTTTTLREMAPLNLAAASVAARRPVVLMQTVGKEVAVALQRHFKERDGEGNRHGWPSRHFWKRVADKTSHQNATADGVTVTVASAPFVHKLTGGRIVAKEAGALAIPLTAEAYAKQGQGTLRESFPGLFVLQTKKGAWLVRSSLENRGQSRATRVKGQRRERASGVQRERLEFLFRLVKSVDQPADPRALPPEGTIPAAIDRAIAGYAQRNAGGVA
jgi:hypothetical protein